MVCIIKKYSIVVLLLYIFNNCCTEDTPNPTPLEKLDELLDRIPAEEVLRRLTEKEKREFLKDLFGYNKDTENRQKQ